MSAALSPLRPRAAMPAPPGQRRQVARRLKHLRVLRLLRDAAESGERCPTVDDIAYALDLDSYSKISLLLREMEEQGLIRIQQLSMHHRIISAGTGAWSVSTRPHQAGGAEAPPRPCSRCHRPFRRASRFVFRCEPCRDACAEVMP